MKFYVTLALITCWPIFYVSAQTSNTSVLVTTVDKGCYFLIPKSALANSVDGIIYQDKTLRKAPINNRPIELYWSSICNDGYYKITVTPEQIFFSSSHDNPNPNYLFWVITIDRKCYDNIRKGLSKNPPKNFLDLSKVVQAPGLFKDESTTFYKDRFSDLTTIPANWSDAELAAHCKTQISQKLSTYFNLLNSYILNPRQKLTLPKSNSPKLFSYFRDEIQGWLPVKTKR